MLSCAFLLWQINSLRYLIFIYSFQEFMVNPVIASSGMSYEKSLLDDHVKANGEVDPVTRANIDPTKYIENKNLKLAI